MKKTAVVVISDTHVGSHAGLCPPGGLRLRSGGLMMPSKLQRYIGRCWADFWNNWVPQVTAGCEVRYVVHNGDAIEGNHHQAVDIIPDVQTQQAAFCEVMRPILAGFDRFYMTCGTPAHGQVGEQSTEEIAERLGAVPDPESGASAWWQLWLDVQGTVMQFAHHIATTSSAAYETSAPMRELVSGLVEAAQWGNRLPDIFVRSHRHRYQQVSIPAKGGGHIELLVTPAWQARTPHVERVDRMRLPHVGGAVFVIDGRKTWTTYPRIYPWPKPPIQKG